MYIVDLDTDPTFNIVSIMKELSWDRGKIMKVVHFHGLSSRLYFYIHFCSMFRNQLSSHLNLFYRTVHTEFTDMLE